MANVCYRDPETVGWCRDRWGGDWVWRGGLVSVSSMSVGEVCAV